MRDIFILGKDRRFDHLSSLLEEDGHRIFREATSPFPERSVIVFPLGAGEEEILPILENLKKESLVFVGRGTKVVHRKAKERGILLVCLLEEKTYLLENSLATAEGALAEVIGKTDCLLSELCILICGYGNCGKALARLFWLCGAEVWVFSHEGSLEKARQDGFNVYRAPGNNMGMFDVILNTVPSPLLTEDFIRDIRKGAHIFQVASGLSGADEKDLSRREIRFHPLPGLPGKYAPATEGSTLYRILDRTINQSETESE